MPDNEQTRNKRAQADNFKGSKGTPFKPEKQPTGAQKSAGWAKRRAKLAIRDLIKDIFDSEYKFKSDSQVKQQLEAAFGNIDKKTVKELMVLQQAQKAILKGDTIAFSNAINQAYGLPQQAMDLTSGGKEIKAPIINVISTDDSES